MKVPTHFRKKPIYHFLQISLASAVLITSVQVKAQDNATSTSKPNIIVIMADDVGWFNIGAYNQGIMSTKHLTWISLLPKV